MGSPWYVVALAAVVELLLVVAAYQAYSAVRLLVAGQRGISIEHGLAILHMERAVHLEFERNAQRAALHPLWLVRLLNYAYVYLYLPLICATGVVLFLREPAVYTRARRTFLLSGAIGLIIFARFPVAPPRLLPGGAFVDTVDRYFHNAGYASNPLANQFAAVPSFHFGWTVLASHSLWPVLHWRLARSVLVLLPVVMLAAIVVTGNHLWFDAVAGVVVVSVAGRLAPKLDRLPRPSVVRRYPAPVPIQLQSREGRPAPD